ncbi:MAG: type II toxin-antitoxin system HicB family antitoxin [Candidatus Hydrogenedentota bacterium]
MKYTIILKKGKESGYTAVVPALKGCVSQGKTRTEALKNIKEAIQLYVETLLEDGMTVPREEYKDIVELKVAVR